MGKVIVITSGKGGVGKTTSSANLGAALAMQNQKTLLIDTDIGLRNLDVVMGLENRIVYDLIDVIEGVCKPKQAIIKDKRNDNLHLLPAAQSRDKNAIAAAEEAYVVTTPEISAVRDADRIIGLLEANEIRNPKLIVNRLRVEMVKDGNMLSVDDVTDILEGQSIASPTEVFYYYQKQQLQAVRWRNWKYHLPLQERIKGPHLPDTEVGEARLYDLGSDLSETENVIDRHPEVVRQMNKLIEEVRSDMGDWGYEGRNQRPAGVIDEPFPRVMN